MRCVVFILAHFLAVFVSRAETESIIELIPEANFTVALSNAPNDAVIRLSSGVYPVLPSKVLSNGLGGVNLFNKTNITIEGVPGETIIDGTQAVGALLYITNSSKVTLRGLTFRGLVVTNYTLLAGIGHVWATLPIYAVDHLTIENCRFIDGHDHAIHDMGAQANWNTISTNNILIRSNFFDNFGSARSNEVISVDGAAIVPTGWTVEGNEFRNCLRCVEPFTQNDPTPNPFFNCIIRSNRMINTLDAAILTAGSTNGNQLVIEGNFIYNDLGYSRRGSNMYAGYGIVLNDGHGHVVRGNQIVNAAYTGIAIGGSPYNTSAILIESNIIENTDARNQGFGIFAIANETAEVRNLTIRKNLIKRAKNHSIYLLSTRDAVVIENTILNPTVGGGAAIKLSTYNGSSNVNVLIASNIISDTTSKMTFGIEVTTNNHLIRAIENCIDGYTVGIVANQAGAELLYASRGLNCPASPLKVRLNEWLSFNSGVLRDPSDRDAESCFEVYNLEPFSVDLSGYFLTDDLNDPRKFKIPDLEQSVMPPDGYLTIWADNEPHQNLTGVADLHVNFSLNRDGGVISLRANETEVIDTVNYGAQISDVSEGRDAGTIPNRIYMSPPSMGYANLVNENPTIVETRLNGSEFRITIISKRGATYQILSSGSPDASQWTPIGEPVEASDSLTQITAVLTTAKMMFFKAATVP